MKNVLLIVGMAVALIAGGGSISPGEGDEWVSACASEPLEITAGFEHSSAASGGSDESPLIALEARFNTSDNSAEVPVDLSPLGLTIIIH